MTWRGLMARMVVAVLVAGAVAGAVAGPVQADPVSGRTWVGPGTGGSFSDPANWSPSGVPQTGEWLGFQVASGATQQVFDDIPNLWIGAVIVQGGGELDVYNAPGTSVQLLLGSAYVGAGSALVAFTPIRLTAGIHGFTVEAGSRASFAQVVSGPGGIDKYGPGDLSVAGSFTGGTTVEAGRLLVSRAPGTGRVTVHDGGQVLLTGTTPFTNLLHLDGAGPDGSGSLVLAASNGVLGRIVLDGPTTIGNAFVGSTADLHLSGPISGTGPLVITQPSGFGGLTWFDAKAANTYSGGLIVDNEGVLLEDSGGNAVSGGGLIVTGGGSVFGLRSEQIADSGSVWIDSGSTAGFTSETVQSVVSRGTLNLVYPLFGTAASLTTRNLTLSTGSSLSLAIDLSGDSDPPQSVLAVTGQAQLAGTVTVSVNKPFPALVPGTAYRFLDDQSSHAIVGTFDGRPEGSVLSTNRAGDALQLTYAGGDGNDVVGTVVAAP